MEKWPADKEKLTFFLLIYIYIYIYIYIPLHSCDYLQKTLIRINVVTDEGKKRK